MTHDTLEFLKWFIGLPGAIVATLTLPLVMRKYHLECKKLQYEIRKIEIEVGKRDPHATKRPGPMLKWFANYWAIPCYGSLGLLAIVSALTKSMIWMLVAMVVSLILFVSGSAVSERYTAIFSAKSKEDQIGNKET